MKRRRAVTLGAAVLGAAGIAVYLRPPEPKPGRPAEQEQPISPPALQAAAPSAGEETGERDRPSSEAVALYAQAERLRIERTAQSLPAALDTYRQALERFRQEGEELLEARALLGIGKTLIAGGQPREALPHFEQAISLYRLQGTDQERARAYKEAGSAYRRLGEPGRARELFNQAIDLARSAGDDGEVASALNNLGVLHASLGEKQYALTAYSRALEIWRQVGNEKRRNTALHNLGELYVSLGRFEEGLDFLRRASAGYRQAGDFGRQAVTVTAIGWAHRLQEDFEAALASYDQALGLQRAVGDKQGESLTLDQRGTAYLRLGRHAEALESFQQALRLVEGNRLYEAYTRLNLGAVHLAAGRPDAAGKPLKQALEIFRELGAVTGEAEALTAIARLERRLGRLPAARARLQTALGIIESVRGRLQPRGLRASYFAVQQGVVGAYVDLLMQLEAESPGHGHAARAFEASERARARALLESLAEARAGVRAAAAPELLDRERSLRARINLEEGRRMELIAEGSVARATSSEREVRSLLLEYEKVQGEIGAAGKSSWSELAPRNLKQIQQEVLDDDSLLLAYSLGEERSFLWVVGRDSLTGHVLPSRPVIDQLASRVHKLMPRRHVPGRRRQATAAIDDLSEAVLAPAARRLNRKRLLILADGALHYVPFAALSIPDTGAKGSERGPPFVPDRGNPLIADHELVYLPSASVLAQLRRQSAERRPAPGLIAVVADPVFQHDDPRLERGAREDGAGSGSESASETAVLERNVLDFGTRFERLPFAGVEADAVLALAAGAESLRATGLEATRELVLSGRLDHYRIVHFATHGLLNTVHPALSGIVLSLVDEAGRPRDGLLRVHEIYDLPLSADLVVLSGCRTALGKRVRGEGLLGLTQGFFYAGAKRLVVSFWNVNDRATAELMTRFYRGMLRDHQPPAQALRAAQLSMLGDAEWQAPYYWAGFALHGEWR